MLNAFIYGANGQKMTPDQVAQKRKVANAARARMGDTSPVDHWTQGAARVVDALGGVINERRADRGEEVGLASADEFISADPVLAGLIGGGGASGLTGGAGSSSFLDSLIAGESSGRPDASVTIDDGRVFAGLGGVGEGRLADMKQAGVVPADMTLADFASAENAGLQRAALEWHIADIDKAIDATGALGQGYDRDGLRAVAHLGGQAGMRRFIDSGGDYNPNDSYTQPNGVATRGTSLSDYYSKFGGVSSGAPARGGADVVTALSSAMSNPWVAEKYGPVIEQLMSQEQRRGDMIFQDNLRQSDPMYQAQLAQFTAPTVNEAPKTETIYDPETGREQVMEWDGEKWVPLGGVAGESGPMVKVENYMGADKFAEAFASGDAAALATIDEGGMSAKRNMSRIDTLEQLLANSPSGLGAVLALKAGDWGVKTEGLNELQAAQAIISSLIPEQRQPGSGPMSDSDLELFKQSLPRIINQPGGNAFIINTMRSIAEYDAAGAEIVQRVRSGELTRADAFQALQSRRNPMSAFSGPASGSPPPSAAGKFARMSQAELDAIDLDGLGAAELQEIMVRYDELKQ